jgi:mono/diheme cytochrome c family protein
MRSKVSFVALLVLLLTACGQNGNDAAGRGKQVYLTECIACHNMDPARDGVLGPAIKGASQELLEAKVLRGAYPPGYTPKRATALMPPIPKLAPQIANLAAFLR